MIYRYGYSRKLYTYINPLARLARAMRDEKTIAQWDLWEYIDDKWRCWI